MDSTNVLCEFFAQEAEYKQVRVVVISSVLLNMWIVFTLWIIQIYYASNMDITKAQTSSFGLQFYSLNNLFYN